MKNLIKLFGIIIVAVIIVYAMAACDLLDNLGGDSSNSGSGNNSNPTTVAVTGVSLKSATTLVVGGTETLYAAIDPPTATNQNVTWSSGNSSVATVSANGTVTAVAAGIASITVKTVDGNKTAGCNVSVVTSPVAVTGVTLNKSSTSLNVGDAETLVPIITPSGATNQNVTWASSNASTATVSAGGLVTAVAAGTTIITVTTVDGNKTAICNVTITGSIPANTTFTSVAAFKTWLDAQAENTPNTAYGVTLNLSSLDDLHAILQNAPYKYVSLDLSGSTFTSIGTRAFENCTSLSSVTIGNSVTSIGDYAFSGCYSLASITIGNSVTSIGDAAFDACTSLTSVTIPASVSSMGYNVFGLCYSLAVINVASDNNAFVSENGVLYNKNKTTLIRYPIAKSGSSFTIPNSVVSFGAYAFWYCDSLKSISIPDSVTSIGANAFFSCKRLASITIPDKVTSIGISAFENCYDLVSVTFQGTISSGGFGYAFYGDLREKYLAGGPGSYTTTAPVGLSSVWTKSGGGGDVAPGGTYIITERGTSFTATNGSVTVGSGAIQDVINAIRTHAAGKDLIIQFGNGTILDSGTVILSFNNSGGTWGAVTLTGKITTSGYISIDDSISVTSTADIANTHSNNTAIHHSSTGTLNITGGTISAMGVTAVYKTSTGKITVSGTAKVTSASTDTKHGTISLAGRGILEITGGTVENTATGNAIRNAFDDAITISGGTVSATSGVAVHNSRTIFLQSGQTENQVNGMLNITGGTVSATSGIAMYIPRGRLNVSGNAKVTSANTNTTEGTIFLGNYQTTSTARLIITGGTVENTSTTTGNAVRNDSTDTISITGGTVSKAGNGNYAVYNGGTGTVTIRSEATIVGNNYGL